MLLALLLGASRHRYERSKKASSLEAITNSFVSSSFLLLLVRHLLLVAMHLLLLELSDSGKARFSARIANGSRRRRQCPPDRDHPATPPPASRAPARGPSRPSRTEWVGGSTAKQV